VGLGDLYSHSWQLGGGGRSKGREEGNRRGRGQWSRGKFTVKRDYCKIAMDVMLPQEHNIKVTKLSNTRSKPWTVTWIFFPCFLTHFFDISIASRRTFSALFQLIYLHNWIFQRYYMCKDKFSNIFLHAQRNFATVPTVYTVGFLHLSVYEFVLRRICQRLRLCQAKFIKGFPKSAVDFLLILHCEFSCSCSDVAQCFLNLQWNVPTVLCMRSESSTQYRAPVHI
jgi:hypothetical protein